MRLSLGTLALLVHNGDSQAIRVMDQYESHAPSTPVDIYYLGEEDLFILHTPTMAVKDHLILPKRSPTLVGLPQITIYDNGECDENDD